MKNPSHKGHCEDCKWFVVDEHYPANGECRKSPPTLVLCGFRGSLDAYVVAERESAWPYIKADAYCGAFEMKEWRAKS